MGGGGNARSLLVLDDVLALAELCFDTEERESLLRADQADAGAQTDVGQMLYLRGCHAAAVYWLRLAADQGDTDAMQCLGRCYAAGEGVARDENLALMWIAKAAAAGHFIAREQMAFVTANRPIQQKIDR